MRRLALLALFVAAVPLTSMPPAVGGGRCVRHVCAGTSQTGIWASIDEKTTPGAPPPAVSAAATHPAGYWQTVPVCALGGQDICHAASVCPDGTTQQETYFVADDGTISSDTRWCPSVAAPPAQPALTRARILEAFRRLPLPESPLLIQPAGGKTIVNFDTIFYTTRGPFTRTVALLGHRITFAIEPASFTWVWGDGDQRVTSTPGRPFQRGVPVKNDITHRYLTKDRFEPRLDTTYTATYAVDGGPARPVGGTVTITGTPQELATVTYTPLLVND